MTDFNFPLESISSPSPLRTRGGRVHEPLPPKKLNRHRSANSCHSSQSVVSNASSTKTHRRSVVEVGSFLGYGSPGSVRTMEPREGYAKEPTPGSQQRVRRQISAETNRSINTPEGRGPISDRVESGSHCSRVHDIRSSFDSMDSACSKSNQVHHERKGGAPESKKHQDDDVLRAVELIRELSFDISAPQRTPASYPKKTPCTLSSADQITQPVETTVNEDAASTRVDEPIVPQLKEESEAPDSPVEPRASIPLPPKINRIASIPEFPSHVVPNRNRARSTSISEMSDSYFNEFVNGHGEDDASSKTSSTCTSNNDELSAGINNKKKSLITIENNVNIKPRALWSQGRASTIASDQSSYISSASSSFDHLSIDESQAQVEDEVDQSDIDVEDKCLNQETGHLSLQEGKCNIHIDESSAELIIDPGVSRPQLNAATLREWNAICEQEDSKIGVTKNQFIFRVLSCPNKMNVAASPNREGICRDPENTNDESVEEPHLMATTLSQIISVSQFSYTNTYEASTLSSKKNDADEVTSDLDFDMEFIYSADKSSVSTPLESAGKRNPGHRKSFSFSSGSRRGKPFAVSKAVVHAENVTPPPLTNKSAPKPGSKSAPKLRHRRFKSDGSIFCKKQRASLSQFEFNVSDKPSFKSKLKNRRHHRVKSLGSFKDPQSIDCSSLQCIIEDFEEASKSSNSADSSSVVLVDFLRKHLEKMSATRVLELGFLFGLFVGLLIPYVFRAIFVV